MVFKTIESDITKSGQALSLFGKQVNYIFRDIGSAISEIKSNKFSKQSLSLLSPDRIFGSGLSEQDIQALRNYNKALVDCQDAEGNLLSTNTVFYQHLRNSSSAAQELARNANGAAVSEEVLAEATNKVTTATKLASGAMRLLANVGLALAINLIITGITKAVNRFKEIKESTDNLISSFKSLKEESDDLAKNSNTLVSEYSKLAKGVNSLGENVSLTADEYERYKEVANQIAEDIPSLIIGYDNEGNAILKLKDNVDELKQSYIDARKEKYRLMLEEDQTTEDAIKNYHYLKETSVWASSFDFGKPDVGKSISVKDAVQDLKTILNSSYKEAMKAISAPVMNDGTDVLTSRGQGYLAKLGFNINTTEEEFLELQKVFRTELQKLEAEIENGLTGIKSIANMYLFSDDDYYNLSEDMQNIASIVINSIPDDLAETWENKYDINEYVHSVIQKLKDSTPKVQSAYKNLFNLSLGDLSIPEAKKQVDEYIQEIADYLGVDANQLKIQFGFEFVDENEEELDHILKRAVDKYNTSKKGIERSLLLNFINEEIDKRGINTKEELTVLAECIDKTNSLTDAFELYDVQIQQTKSNNSETTKSIKDLSEVLETASKEQSALKSAMEDMADTGYLSSDTYATLVEMGGNFTDCLEVQNGKLVLNIEKLKELKKAEYDLEIQTKNLAIAETEHNIALYAQGGHVEDVKRLTEELTRLRQEKAALITAQDEFDNVKPDDKKSSSSSSKSEKPQSVLDFEKELKDYQHEINMGRKEEDAEYYDWLDKRAHEVYSGLADYQDELYKYEEEVYKGRKKLAEDLYNDRIEKLESQITVAENKGLDSNGNFLNVTEKFNYIRDTYSSLIAETQNRIDEIVKSGIKGQEDEIKKLEKQIEDYKDKFQSEFGKYVNELEEYANELSETSINSDGVELNTQEKFREVAAVYTNIQNEIQREINRIIQTGVKGNEKVLEELEKQLKEYADKVTDTFKSAVEAEKSLLEKQKSSLSDIYDKQIDKIKKQQDEAKKAADAEIDLIKEKIDNLKKINDEKQQEYDIEKAKQDLEKSKQKTRMVYGADGTVSYRQDDEKIAEAQQNLDKLLLEKQVNTLETQKSLLEDMRDKESESYDKLIEDIESQKEQDERQFDILIQRLDDYLNPNSDTSNSDVWSEIAKMDGASYRNGKWIDKDGTEIDVAALLSKADKVADNNDKTDNNIKTNNAKTSNNTNTDKVDNQLKTATKTDLKKILKSIGISESIAQSLTSEKLSQIFGLSSVKPNATIINQPDVSKWTTQTQTQRNNNNSQPVNMTFGDIVIQNPVGDAKKLAQEVKGEIFKEAMMQIPNDAMKIIYKN